MLKSARKGTVTYLSDVVVGITSIFSSLFMLLVAALVVFIMNSSIASHVYGDLLYDVPVSGAVMNAILDSQYNNTTVKDLLAYAVWFDNEIFRIDSGRKQIDLKQIFSTETTRLGIGEFRATLATGQKNILLAKAGVKQEKLLKCSEHRIFADGKYGTLTFCMSRIGGG